MSQSRCCHPERGASHQTPIGCCTHLEDSRGPAGETRGREDVSRRRKTKDIRQQKVSIHIFTPNGRAASGGNKISFYNFFCSYLPIVYRIVAEVVLVLVCVERVLLASRRLAI